MNGEDVDGSNQELLRKEVTRKIIALLPELNDHDYVEEMNRLQEEKGPLTVEKLEIDNEALWLITRATEVFLQDFTSTAEKLPDVQKNERKNLLKYCHLTDTLAQHPRLQFLSQILPTV